MHRKSVTKRSGVALFLCVGATLVGEHKENSVAETLEILQAIGIALQDLDLVIAAFGKSIGVWAEKGICNRSKPVRICFCTLDKGRNIAFTRLLDPIRKELLLLIWIMFIKN